MVRPRTDPGRRWPRSTWVADIVVPISLYGHTPGSTGYLDRENQMIATGDAIGSAYVWAHFGLVTQYAESVHHLQDVLRPYARVDVLPAHFYQVKQGLRGKPPLNGRPLDKAYVADQVRVADGILSGRVIGEPYRTVGRNAVIGTVDSAQTVYTLGNLYPGGVFAGTGDRTKYHAVAIPGRVPATSNPRYAAVDRIRCQLYLIRDYGNQTMYLIAGTNRALLIGSGEGTPGLATFVRNLVSRVPIDVIAMSDDPGQIGGLRQFVTSTVYVPRGMAAPQGVRNITYVGGGDRIDLGTDSTGVRWCSTCTRWPGTHKQESRSSSARIGCCSGRRAWHPGARRRTHPQGEVTGVRAGAPIVAPSHRRHV